MKDFAARSAQLGADPGFTAVLHTHTRRLDYHPHLHVVVPGGAVDPARRQWKKLKEKYLFNAFALAKVFRARFLAALNTAGIPIPDKLPDRWVVDCREVGKGEPALKYLSRYLYKGVIAENHIIGNSDGQITFRYQQGGSGNIRKRTLNGEDFLWLVLQHVLPRGFHRVRDYGFLHPNAKKRLQLIQLILRVFVAPVPPRPRPAFRCRKCQSPLLISGFMPAVRPSG